MKRLFTLLLSSLLILNSVFICPVKAESVGEEIVEQEPAEEEKEEIDETIIDEDSEEEQGEVVQEEDEEIKEEESVPEEIEEEDDSKIIKKEEDIEILGEPMADPVPFMIEHYLEVIDDNGIHYEKGNTTYYELEDGTFVNANEEPNYIYDETTYYCPDNELIAGEGVYELPYIESTGLEFIDTKIQIDLTKEEYYIDGVFQLMDSTKNHQPLFGVTVGNTTSDGYWFETSNYNSKNGTIDFSYGAGKNNPSSLMGRRVDSNIHTVAMYIGEDFFNVIYDGDWYYSDQDSVDTIIDRRLYLFANNKGGNNTQYGKYRIYSFNIDIYDLVEEDFTYEARFIPAIAVEGLVGDKVSTGFSVPEMTIGLYNTQDQKFYSNASGNDNSGFVCDDLPFATLDKDAEQVLILKRYFDLLSYDVTFVGLDGDVANDLYKVGEPVTIYNPWHYPLMQYYEGYEFLGYDIDTDSSGDGIIDYVVGDTFLMPNDDIVLKGIYVPHEYEINYELNGGHFDGSAPDVVEYDDVDFIIPNPIRTNHTFTGWTILIDGEILDKPVSSITDFEYLLDEEYLGLYNDETVVTFNANWTATPNSAPYTINYYIEGVNGNGSVQIDQETGMATPGSFILSNNVYNKMPSVGFNYDKTIDINDDSDVDLFEMDYLEVHFDSTQLANEIDKDDIEAEYIETGLLSQDVYKVDMNAFEIDGGPGLPFGDLNTYFSSTKGKLSDAFLYNNMHAFDKGGLSLLTMKQGDTTAAILIAGSLSEGIFADEFPNDHEYKHIIATRNSKEKSLSVGYGKDVETKQAVKGTVSSINDNIPFLLFAANLDDVIIGSNMVVADTKIYGKDDVLLRDYVPTIAVETIDGEYTSTGEEISKGTLGMYDKVEGIFYPSAGIDFSYIDDYYPGAAGVVGDEGATIDITYPRNIHTLYFLDSILYKGIPFDITDLENFSGFGNYYEGDHTFIYQGGIYRLLDKIEYKYGEIIDVPAPIKDVNDYIFEGWGSLKSNLPDFSGYLYDRNGFYDPDYYDDPIEMPDDNGYLTACYFGIESVPAPRLNLTPSYYDINNYPVYEVNPGQKISIICDNPDSYISYEFNDDGSNDYEDSIVLTQEVIDEYFSDGYAELEARSYVKEDSINNNNTIEYSPSISKFILFINPFGDIILQDREFMNFDDPKDIPHALWMANPVFIPDNGIEYSPDVKEYRPTGNVYYYKTLLTEGKDYTVTYSNNKKAGIGTVKITGKGIYAGSISYPFEIKPIQLIPWENTIIELSTDAFVFTGKKQTPKIKNVYYYAIDLNTGNEKRYTLKNGTDYKIIFDGNSTNSGDYSIYLVGLNNYSTSDSGQYIEFEDMYTIGGPYQKLVSKLNISGIKDVNWTGNPIEFDIVVKDGTKTLEKEEDYKIQYHSNIDAGIGSVRIIGTAEGYGHGYIGTVEKTFKIKGVDISKLTYSKLQSSYEYNPLSEIRPQQSITYTYTANGVKEKYNLIQDMDFTVEYKNNTVPGTASIIYTGNPERGFVGTKTVSFKIKGTPLSTYNKNWVEDRVYTGYPIEQNEDLCYTSKVNGETEYHYLSPYGDFVKNYEVEYKNNVNVGTATITFTGVNAYTGTIKKTFKITALPLDDYDIEIKDLDVQHYEKGGNQPDVDIIHYIPGDWEFGYGDYEKELVLNRDYTLSYKNNTKLGTATVTIKGKGNYKGTIVKEFEIEQSNIADRAYAAVADKEFVEKENNAISTLTIYDKNGKKLTAGTDYNKNIEYYYAYDTIVLQESKDNIKTVIRKAGDEIDKKDIVVPGTVINAVVEGINNYCGTLTVSYKICENSLAKASVTVRKQYYTGDEVTLYKDDITVKVGSDIIDSDCYEIVSYKNNTKPGTAEVTIRGKNGGLLGDSSLGGEKTVKFTIVSKPLDSLVLRFFIYDDDKGVITGTMQDVQVSINKILPSGYELPKSSFKSSYSDYKFYYWDHRDYDINDIDYDIDGDFVLDMDDYYYYLQNYNGIVDLFAYYDWDD